MFYLPPLCLISVDTKEKRGVNLHILLGGKKTLYLVYLVSLYGNKTPENVMLKSVEFCSLKEDSLKLVGDSDKTLQWKCS